MALRRKAGKQRNTENIEPDIRGLLPLHCISKYHLLARTLAEFNEAVLR